MSIFAQHEVSDKVQPLNNINNGDKFDSGALLSEATKLLRAVDNEKRNSGCLHDLQISDSSKEQHERILSTISPPLITDENRSSASTSDLQHYQETASDKAFEAREKARIDLAKKWGINPKDLYD